MVDEEFQVFDARLKCPFSLIVAGPSGSGKSTFIANLLLHQARLIDKHFDYILWFYGEVPPEPSLVQSLGNVRAIQGLPDSFDNYIQESQNGLALFEDLMSECSKNEQITDFFARKSHHRNISVIFVTQNFYHQGKERKNFARNAKYLCIFDSPLDKSIPYSLAQKLMPRNQKTFLEIYNHAIDRVHYGYLFIDGDPTSPKNAKFRTDIFGDTQRALIPVKKF